MLCEDKFYHIYRREPEGTIFCPYRICPIGAHVDHNLGKITGLAIDKGIHLAYSLKHNGVVEMTSMQFEKRLSGTSAPCRRTGKTTGPTTFAARPGRSAGAIR